MLVRRLLALDRSAPRLIVAAIVSGRLARLAAIGLAWLVSRMIDAVFLGGAGLAQISVPLAAAASLAAVRAALHWAGEAAGSASASRIHQAARSKLIEHLFWGFAEIEQSVLLASQQLQIAANVRAALIGLENAEARLQRMDQPRYSALRRALSRDIERLKALPLVDIYGTSARLDDAIAGIDKLQLAMDTRVRPDAAASPAAAAADAPAWERVLREAWRELRQLVRVQSAGVQDAALLAPEQVFFLRENLTLRLLGARVALLSRDAKSYQGDLRAALAALERHFDMRDGAVVATAATLRKLQTAQVQAEVPDLAETLEAYVVFVGGLEMLQVLHEGQGIAHDTEGSALVGDCDGSTFPLRGQFVTQGHGVVVAADEHVNPVTVRGSSVSRVSWKRSSAWWTFPTGQGCVR